MRSSALTDFTGIFFTSVAAILSKKVEKEEVDEKKPEVQSADKLFDELVAFL